MQTLPRNQTRAHSVYGCPYCLAIHFVYNFPQRDPLWLKTVLSLHKSSPRGPTFILLGSSLPPQPSFDLMGKQKTEYRPWQPSGGRSRTPSSLPWIPHLPGAPAIPGAPRSPGAPLSPLGPAGPFAPADPCVPGAPTSPEKGINREKRC